MCLQHLLNNQTISYIHHTEDNNNLDILIECLVHLTSFSSEMNNFGLPFREQEHLQREIEMEGKSTCCLQISSVVK